jgi:gamma-butyrobetaine dioxygenase
MRSDDDDRGAALLARGAHIDVAQERSLEPSAVRAAVALHGFARVRGLFRSGEAARSLEGFAGVARVIGERPEMAEVQVLRPVAGARSFAASSVFTPLHTDSQDFLGVAPTLQLLVAVRPARAGGETTLLDAHALALEIDRVDPPLARALFEVRRISRFYFGEVMGPTIALKRGHLVVTHSPMPAPATDPVGRAWQTHVEAAAPLVIPLAAGDVLVVDNHRMLHGRRAFDDPERLLVRTLAWLARPLGDAAAMRARAAEHAPDDGREAAPLAPAVRAVIDLVAGVGPAQIAQREGVSEATLYAWRTRAVEAAARALAAEGAVPPHGTTRDRER